MDNKQIGEMIRLRRLALGMTQEQLAEAIGVSPSAVSMYECGSRRPRGDAVEALADLFNVPKWSILYGENEVAPSDAHAPRTVEAQIVSAAMDDLPKEQRERILGVLRAMYINDPDLFKDRKEDR